MRGCLARKLPGMSDHKPTQTGTTEVAKRGSLKELALFFLRLGTTAFGGPASHIAIMEDELVRRRRWPSHDKFLDLLGASNPIPAHPPQGTSKRWTSGVENGGVVEPRCTGGW